MIGRFITTALFVVAVAACSESPVGVSKVQQTFDAPAASVSVSQTFADVGPFITANPCIPEAVVFSGKIHRTVKTFDDGTLEIKTNYAALKGVGQATGVAYVVQQNNEVQIVDPLPLPFSSTVHVHARIISKGKAPNFDLIFELTVNIPGGTTITPIRAECRG